MIDQIRSLLKKNKKIHNLVKKIIIVLNLRYFIRLYEKYFFLKEIKEFRKLKKPLRIIVAAGDQNQKNWISSEHYTFNIINSKSWSEYFKLNEIKNILAEHIFEHFDENKTEIVLKNIHNYLKQKGCLRIAVPDGFFPNKRYIEWVKPFGKAPGADTHKILYNYLSLKKILEKFNFECILIEYFDEKNNFHINENHDYNGYVNRSRNNDPRNKIDEINYTSLIIDAYKK